MTDSTSAYRVVIKSCWRVMECCLVFFFTNDDDDDATCRESWPDMKQTESLVHRSPVSHAHLHHFMFTLASVPWSSSSKVLPTFSTTGRQAGRHISTGNTPTPTTSCLQRHKLPTAISTTAALLQSPTHYPVTLVHRYLSAYITQN